MGMSEAQLRRLVALLNTGRENVWYNSEPWRSTRETVLRADRYECQRCKERGRYSRAVLVHHVKHLKDRPDLALSIIDPATGERQLVSVCKRCHEELHPEAQRQYRPIGAMWSCGKTEQRFGAACAKVCRGRYKHTGGNAECG